MLRGVERSNGGCVISSRKGRRCSPLVGFIFPLGLQCISFSVTILNSLSLLDWSLFLFYLGFFWLGFCFYMAHVMFHSFSIKIQLLILKKERHQRVISPNCYLFCRFVVQYFVVCIT